MIDDGVGLPGERIEALGQRHSAPQEGRRAEGMGLGLALSMELARQMGAQLRFESPPNGRERGFAARLTLSRADRSTPAGG